MGCKGAAGMTGFAEGAKGHMRKAGVPTQDPSTESLVPNNCTKLVGCLTLPKATLIKCLRSSRFLQEILVPLMHNWHTKALEQTIWRLKTFLTNA